MKDDIGNRMKDQYENRTRYFLPRRTYGIIRVDGKAFHTLTKNCIKPFDKELMLCMDHVAQYLCSKIQGARFAYVQSDEISILITDFDKISTDMWFDGNIQKICSISAGYASSYFNFCYGTFDSVFDSRVFTIPDPTEVENYFIWRQQDATRNSIQMATRALYSHKECENKNTSDLQELLFQKGVNWNNYTAREKRGGLIIKTDNGWEAIECPIFTQDRALKGHIPKYE